MGAASRPRRRLWITLGVVAAGLGILAGVVAATMPRLPVGEQPQLVRSDSRVLGETGRGNAVLVEFLDFECEVCGRAYPFLETVREQYAGRVTFVVRYFPIPAHFNAENAALAAEAAGQQGAYEAMYRMLFESQAAWAEQSVSQAELFRRYAQALGLDLAQYDRDVADPALLERIRRDQLEGELLGVEGTPTFFLNGTKLDLVDASDLTDALNRALLG